MNNPSTFAYRIFGRRLESPFELPTLAPAEPGEPDVRVRFGAVPAGLRDPQIRGVGYEIGPEGFLFSVPGTARFMVRGANDIIIDKDPDAEPRALRMHLLGSVVGALLHQAKQVPLHASGIEVGGGVIGFAGLSGAGKSSLAAAMVKRGHRLVTDDVLAAAVVDGVPVVLPGPASIKLWPDAAAALGEDISGLPRVRGKAGRLLASHHERHVASSLPLTHLYYLVPSNRPDIDVTAIPTGKAFSVIARSTYRARFLPKDRAHHFDVVFAMSRACVAKRVLRPKSRLCLSELCDRIEEDLGL